MIEQKVLDSFRGKHCLVTGGTGMIGRSVVKMLCDAGAEVCVLSLDNIEPDSRAEYFQADLRYFSSCLDWTRAVNYVFHIAGIKGSAKVTTERPASFFVPLLQMNTNILEACRQNEVEKVVYTSSVGAYPENEVFKEEAFSWKKPMDSYPGTAKLMGELQIMSYLEEYGLHNFAVVRPSNVYGPGDGFDPENAMVIPSLMSKILKSTSRGEPISIWGDGSAIRDFAYSRDVAEGIILALYHGTSQTPGGYVNLGSGIGISIRDLIEALQIFITFNYEFDTTKSSGYPKRIMDISLAKELIDYNPTTTLGKGLQETWEWYLGHQEDHLKKQNYFRDEK